MIKFMVHIVKIVLAVCVALLFNSCNSIDFGKSITGSGNVVSKTREVGTFDKIEVGNGLDCEVTQGDQITVVVEADDNLQEGITTKVIDGTLHIESNYSRYKNVKSKKIKVQLPLISILETTSGSDLITTNIIKGTNILLKSSSGSSLEATVEADKITLESTSGSDLVVQGKALELETSSSSGSSIEAQKLLANNITAQSTSGSTSTINPIVTLKAHASSGSSIEYVKTPKNLSIEKNSGGDVSQE
jgi:hypothetical protein